MRYEDKRIAIIGETAMSGRTVAFVTDAGKADRYIAKLTARFPEVIVLERFNGPVAETISVTVGRRSIQ